MIVPAQLCNLFVHNGYIKHDTLRAAHPVIHNFEGLEHLRAEVRGYSKHIMCQFWLNKDVTSKSPNWRSDVNH